MFLKTHNSRKIEDFRIFRSTNFTDRNKNLNNFRKKQKKIIFFRMLYRIFDNRIYCYELNMQQSYASRQTSVCYLVGFTLCNRVDLKLNLFDFISIENVTEIKLRNQRTRNGD